MGGDWTDRGRRVQFPVFFGHVEPNMYPLWTCSVRRVRFMSQNGHVPWDRGMPLDMSELEIELWKHER